MACRIALYLFEIQLKMVDTDKLMSPEEFRAHYFTDASRPCVKSIRNWCKQGHLPAVQIGKSWYIRASEFEEDTFTDALVAKVLKA